MTELNNIPFDKEYVKAYLDRCIRYWREERDFKRADCEKAPFYIDAFQSVRRTLFGEILPEVKVNTAAKEKSLCTEEAPCCDRRNEYNGFGSGPLSFICPKSCPCHD
jgi:hypothetical protein